MTSGKQRGSAGMAVLALGALVLSGCSGPSDQSSEGTAATGYAYGSIPAASSSVKPGGVLRFAEYPGMVPNWIFPITPGANTSTADIDQFEVLSWRPLFWSPKGSAPQWDWSRSMTDGKPTASNGGKTFTIKLNGKYHWSDGTRITAQDVLFWYHLYKAAVKENPANSGNYVPGQFPDNVSSADAVDGQTVSFTFTKVYNPDWLMGTTFALMMPLPAHAWAKSSAGGPMLDYTDPAKAKAIYDYLASQSKSLSTYGTNPLWQVVDGPYKIKSYNTSTGATDFAVNSAYTGEGKPNISEVEEFAYTSPTAEFNDLISGKLDFGYVDTENWPQLGKVRTKGYNLYGLPTFAFNFMYFNFQDGAGGFGKAVSQPYIRQAFAHLQDENAEIKGVYHGKATPAYGPVGVAPRSPYTPANALTNPYPFSVATAKRLLTSHGWSVTPGATTTCTDPGTGPNQCGAGIAKGQNLNFTFYYSTAPKAIGQLVTAFAANLKQVGVNATLKTDTFNNIMSNQNDVSSPKYKNGWGMADFGGFTNDVYPTTDSLFNTTGTYNGGGFSDKNIDALTDNSMYSTDPKALSQEISGVDTALPGIFQPNPDAIVAWSPRLSGSPDSFAAATQTMLDPEDWYFTK